MEKKCMREFDPILIRIVLANNMGVLSYIFSDLRAVEHLVAQPAPAAETIHDQGMGSHAL